MCLSPPPLVSRHERLAEERDRERGAAAVLCCSFRSYLCLFPRLADIFTARLHGRTARAARRHFWTRARPQAREGGGDVRAGHRIARGGCALPPDSRSSTGATALCAQKRIWLRAASRIMSDRRTEGERGKERYHLSPSFIPTPIIYLPRLADRALHSDEKECAF